MVEICISLIFYIVATVLFWKLVEAIVERVKK
jgi:hypothetical protein